MNVVGIAGYVFALLVACILLALLFRQEAHSKSG